MTKAFDWVDRDLLLLKRLLSDIEGKIYNVIKAIYNSTVSNVRVNGMVTDWSHCTSVVYHGDILSTTLFSIFIDDLVLEIKDLCLGISVYDILISILLYVDDIVLFAETEPELQTILTKLNEWCSKWKMSINETKTNVVHFRNKHQLKTQYVFKVGNNSLNVVDRYKYLVIILNTFLEFEVTASTLRSYSPHKLYQLCIMAQKFGALKVFILQRVFKIKLFVFI